MRPPTEIVAIGVSPIAIGLAPIGEICEHKAGAGAEDGAGRGRRVASPGPATGQGPGAWRRGQPASWNRRRGQRKGGLRTTRTTTSRSVPVVFYGGLFAGPSPKPPHPRATARGGRSGGGACVGGLQAATPTGGCEGRLLTAGRQHPGCRRAPLPSALSIGRFARGPKQPHPWAAARDSA